MAITHVYQARHDRSPRGPRACGHGCGALQTTIAIDPIGVQDPEQHRRPAAPVVSHDVCSLELERVQQRHLVGCVRLAVVAMARRLGPAEPAQVGRQEAVLTGQGGHHPAPHVPVLGPAVEE